MKNTFAAIKFWMDKILSIACAVLLTFMTVLVLIQVFSRYILNSPVAFTEELVRYSLIWTGFIGAAYAFSTREHMSLTLIRDKFTGKAHTALLVVIDGLILLMAIFVFTIGGFKLAVSASREFSALLGIPRSLVYSIAPISGVFIVLAQIINIYEDVTGEKVESKEGADKCVRSCASARGVVEIASRKLLCRNIWKRFHRCWKMPRKMTSFHSIRRTVSARSILRRRCSIFRRNMKWVN